MGDKVPVAWYEIQTADFVRHVVAWKAHSHGIGCGDVNGDGRNDILTPQGWYEAPPDPREGRVEAARLTSTSDPSGSCTFWM